MSIRPLTEMACPSDDTAFPCPYCSCLVASTGWPLCFAWNRTLVHRFYEASMPVLESLSVLAQLALLLFISCECGANMQPEPSHIILAISKLQSHSSLVRYYATSAISNLIPAIQDNETWRIVREVISDSLLAIIDCTVTIARDCGVPGLIPLVSVLIKDEVLLSKMIGDAPSLVVAAFGIATNFVHSEIAFTSVFDTLLNLIMCVKNNPEAELMICGQIYALCLSRFEILCRHQSLLGSLIEMLATIVAFCPIFDPSFWNAADLIHDLSEIDQYRASFLYHNLLVRDRQRVVEDLPKFLNLGIGFLKCRSQEQLAVISNFNFRASLAATYEKESFVE
jgi:hypothetical protein